nr:hypothetical protein [Tanacetum cinerariifolium]
VEASPHDSELVSLVVVEIVILEVEEIEEDNLHYEAFYFDDDHIKEISSGSTTTHSDISLSEYVSFIFIFAHEEFIDELAHFISPPEYDRFYFKDLPDQ